MTESNSTLSVGKYLIELSTGGTQIFAVDNEGQKSWVCTTTDPERAMSIVEGLILVEMKRFYHPESKPKVNTNTGSVLPFLKKKDA